MLNGKKILDFNHMHRMGCLFVRIQHFTSANEELQECDITYRRRKKEMKKIE